MKGKTKMEQNEMRANTAENGATENEPFRLKVKYNHEELLIPEDEAVVLAQKGLNYDKVLCSLNELKEDKSLALLDKLSKECGYSDRLSFLNGITELEREEKHGELTRFLKENPSVNVKEIPDSVISDYLSGKSISESFLRYHSAREKEGLLAEIERLNGLLEIKTEERENNESANESLGYAVGATGEYYSDEELDALSDSDLSQNLERAIKSMSRLSRKNK